jgi:uncharacterized protein YjiS (DUF1127 family)
MGICESHATVLDEVQQLTQRRLIDQRKRTMTFAITNNTQAPLGAVAILRVVDSILNLKNVAVAWNEARVTRKVLSGLSVEQLQDIGLN